MRRATRYLTAESFSLTATWALRTALAWLLFQASGSSATLARASLLNQLPVLLLATAGGVVVDRLPQLKLLAFSHCVIILECLAVSLALAHKVVSVRFLIGMILLHGTVVAIEMTVRQSLCARIASDDHRQGTVTALASLMSLTRQVGPALGAFALAVIFGSKTVLAVALFYVVALGLLVGLREHRPERLEARARFLVELREGWDYVASHRTIRMALLLTGLLTAAGVPASILVPVFATEVLKGDARVLAVLLAGSGAGALSATVCMHLKIFSGRLAHVLVASLFVAGTGFVVFSRSHGVWLSAAASVVTGFAGVTGASSANIMVQQLVPDAMRGRVMSYYTLAFVANAPAGTLLTWAFLPRMGAGAIVFWAGVAAVLGATAALGSVGSMAQEFARLRRF